MKTRLNIFIGLFLLLTSCNNSTTVDRKNYVEREPTFFELRNGDWLTNKWIRKPENLLTIHETYKKVGYNNILGQILSDNPIIIQDIYINKKGNPLIDSLVLTYRQRDTGTKYYKEFWARREKEKNIDKLDLVIVADFLATFHESCKNNAEFSEWSNELLFKVINKKPDKVLELISKNSSLYRDYILNELANPIQDQIALDSIIDKIRKLNIPNSNEWKGEIIKSLETAKGK